MGSTGLEHMYVWENFSSLINNLDIYSQEFYATLHLKKELYDRNNACEGCGNKGMFDIWDVKLNGTPLYRCPKPDIPQTQFFFTKENGQIFGEYRPIVSGNNVTNLSMFEVARQVVNGIPKSQFKEFDNGFLDIIAYRMDNFDCAPNRFRHGGLSYKDIINAIDSIENNYKIENGVDW
ncbi:MAG: hypothetical protein KDD32_09875 [Bacteroidetes bacterium]|nr:hypothetical protein [Bacteroidota bacterium]